MIVSRINNLIEEYGNIYLQKSDIFMYFISFIPVIGSITTYNCFRNIGISTTKSLLYSAPFLITTFGSFGLLYCLMKSRKQTLEAGHVYGFINDLTMFFINQADEFKKYPIININLKNIDARYTITYKELKYKFPILTPENENEIKKSYGTVAFNEVSEMLNTIKDNYKGNDEEFIDKLKSFEDRLEKIKMRHFK